MKLKEQYEYEAAIHMYKFVHNKLPLSFKHTFKFHYEVQSSHLTRQSSLIYIERCHSNLPFTTIHCLRGLCEEID